jgi:hypothetical protein
MQLNQQEEAKKCDRRVPGTMGDDPVSERPFGALAWI